MGSSTNLFETESLFSKLRIRQAFKRLTLTIEKHPYRPPISGSRGLAPLRGVGQRPTNQITKRITKKRFTNEGLEVKSLLDKTSDGLSEVLGGEGEVVIGDLGVMGKAEGG